MNFLRLVSPSKSKRPPSNDDIASEEQRPAKICRVVVMDGQEDSYYSAIDSDSEPSLPVRMDWRTDPQKSLSDWTIEVVSVGSLDDDSQQYNLYNVHKNVLILESDYFQWFFGEYKTAISTDENTPTATRLELHEKAARFFPDFLDYMYGQDPNFTSENATVFHFFGHFFGMRRLRCESKQFWQHDMTPDTVATYYEDAIVFGDPKVMMMLQEACCKDGILLGFNPDSPILQVPDPRLWLYLVQNAGPRHSEHVSRIVAWFCNTHMVDAQTFLKLTAPQDLPVIDFSVTLTLLSLEQLIFGGPSASLTSLQVRCIATLENRWKDIEVTKPEVSNFMLQQSPVFVTELFKRTLAAAQGIKIGVEQMTILPATTMLPKKASHAENDAVSADDNQDDEKDADLIQDHNASSMSENEDKDDPDHFVDPADVGHE